MDVAPGTTVLADLVGVACVAGFGSLVCNGHLAREHFVGEAGLTGEADGTFLPADDGGRGTVWDPGQRRTVSWMVPLSRAVFCQNKETNHQLDI